MKKSFILLGISGIVIFFTSAIRAQDAPPADKPEPAPKKIRTDDTLKLQTPVMQNPQLLDKLKAAGASPSPQVLEIVRMSDAGMDTGVLKAYAENAPAAVQLRPEEIIYLKDHGISNSIITAMIERGAKLREQGVMAVAVPPPPPAPAPAVPSPDTMQATAPAYVPSATYTYANEPIYFPSSAYAYPSYYYPWYPSFGIYFGRPSYYGYRRFAGGFGRGVIGGHSSGFGHSTGHFSGFHH